MSDPKDDEGRGEGHEATDEGRTASARPPPVSSPGEASRLGIPSTSTLRPPPPPVSPSGRPPPPPSIPPPPPSGDPTRSSQRPSKPQRSEELLLNTGRDRFGVGLLWPMAIAALAANLIAGLLAPGFIGSAGNALASRWRWWATITPLAAAILGIGSVIALVMAAVANPRTSISTRIVATFGAGLVLTLTAAALRGKLEQTQLIVLFAGAFAVLVASAVEALAPPPTRALGVMLGLLALSSLLRVAGWGLAWSASHKNYPSALGLGQTAASVALVLELLAQGFAVLYLFYRPGFRGAIAAVIAVGAAFALSMYTLRTVYDPNAAGTTREALQHAVSLRVQGLDPLPSWVDRAAGIQEIALLEARHRLGLLPLVFAEFASLTLPLAAFASVSRPTLGLVAAVSLAVLSRGQVDTPLRALELCLAALGALVLSRGARVRQASNARQSERPTAK